MHFKHGEERPLRQFENRLIRRANFLRATFSSEYGRRITVARGRRVRHHAFVNPLFSALTSIVVLWIAFRLQKAEGRLAPEMK
jgi:hypothetical protein